MRKKARSVPPAVAGGRFEEQEEELIRRAARARRNSIATYSKFRVGAALLADNGEIYSGCNIENASYGLTLCAERVAIFKALSEGTHQFKAIAVVTDTKDLTPPCGACRQIIWEFCGDVLVVLANLQQKIERHRMSELLPRAFDGRILEKKSR